MKNTKICIIGSGVVGQATGKALQSKGLSVVFTDINPTIISTLKKEGYKALIVNKLSSEKYDFDATFFCVPTPTVDGKSDLRIMKSVCKDLGKWLSKISKYHLVVVRSTVIPGTTESLVLKTIEEHSGKKFGKDLGLCMNPEYLRQKTSLDDTLKPWVIVIGEFDIKSGETLREIYKDFDCPIYRIPIVEAEIQKYVHNIFNATKITFFNEMRIICKQLGLNPENIFPLVAKSAEGMWNPNYGIKDLGAFDGACLPKDIQAFLAWASNLNLKTPLLKETVKINESLSTKEEEVVLEIPKEENLNLSQNGLLSSFNS
ncbi:UDP-glucose/GDP-mannose dehydrogenase family protein [Candidatus Daviesbacteria bacterium]|nr:UDP-glucose/GDP-mannose dehydrogenase family protein [Candidatus Daviesbacteria bacterium]